ncbi:MAG: bifunctional metallophosphatase/5'-nucleotidase [Terrimonas sp.]|nr:bifunctional metallophosphatase/5'-nucleotidase [Terrimonas sp.]
MLNRRDFLQQSVLATGSLVIPGKQLLSEDLFSGTSRLTILHTNDTHSRIDPFPMDGSRNQGLGGVAARSHLIQTIRKEEEQVLLLDAGDIFQGTPYFNIYKGEPEIRSMTAMDYDATTIGNHDFDAGMENLAHQLQWASFPMLICNYDFTGTAMEYKTLPYKVFKKGKIKVGVFGVGIELKGLVTENLFGETQYRDPVKHANETANLLKNREGCDFIICLSHLGYQYQGEKVSDERLAKDSDAIDLIIGGHTHTFMDEPAVFRNRKGNDVVVNQVGWAGIMLGRLDYEFSKFSGKKLVSSRKVLVTKKTNQ